MDVGIQSFGLGIPATDTSAEILGGKGAGLVWMDSQGVSVPPGFILPTTLWAEYTKDPNGTMQRIEQSIQPWLARMTQKFGYIPLLSVRSGARVSCPGMLDTILNVGLTPSNQLEWEDRLGEKCVGNCFHRLAEMYCTTVLGKRKEDASLSFVPAAAGQQILGAIEAVFKSWNNERAVYYRKLHNIPGDWGTAVVLQAMVFGNMNSDSGTGVLFTRNPDTGKKEVTGEFLINAQGEDVVAGTATPMDLTQMTLWSGPVYDELIQTVLKLEALRKDVQDVEFTIQDGTLFILQTRNAKRTALAAVKIAVDMVEEGLIDRATALKRVTKAQYALAQKPTLDPFFTTPEFAKGIPACSGVVTGIALPTKSGGACAENYTGSEPFILIGEETTPDDIKWMDKSIGVLTMKGGATSHAAVVARSMDKPCVVGLGGNLSDFGGKQISIDGATGRVWIGSVPTVGGADNMIQFDEMLWEEAKAVPLGVVRKGAVYLDLTDDLRMGAVERAVDTLREFLNQGVDVTYRTTTPDSPIEASFFGLFGNAKASANARFDEAIKTIPAPMRKRLHRFGDDLPQVKTVLQVVKATGPVRYVGTVDAYIEKIIKMKEAIGEVVVVGEQAATNVRSKAQVIAELLA